MADSFVAPDHPVQNMLFCALGECYERERRLCEELAAQLEFERVWVLGPPEFIDELEDRSKLPPGMPPLHTLGLVLKIHSALPPWTLPRDVDHGHFKDVSSILASLQDLTKREGLEFGVELDGERIGEVEGGQLTRGLIEGLIAPWKKHVGL